MGITVSTLAESRISQNCKLQICRYIPDGILFLFTDFKRLILVFIAIVHPNIFEPLMAT